MKLYHLTPDSNCGSITTLGLLLSKSRTVPPYVFLVPKIAVRQQSKHVAARHTWDPDKVATYEVEVPRGWLERYASNVWRCDRDIGPERLVLLNRR